MLLKYLTVCLAAELPSNAASVPLLTAISQDPELGSFYQMFNSSDGTAGLPGPPFEERINSVLDGRRFTAFAPTNAALAKIPVEVLEGLKRPDQYPLMEAILRSHLTDGEVEQRTIEANGSSAAAVEGGLLVFNKGVDGGVRVNDQANIESTTPQKVENGAIYKIDAPLDPFAGFFGHDTIPEHGPAHSNVWEPRRLPKSACMGENRPTMAAILRKNPQFSIYRNALTTVAPDFILLLDSFPTSNPNVSLFAPTNAVFEALAPGAMRKMLAPFNQPITSFLLKFHLAEFKGKGNTDVRAFPNTPLALGLDGQGAIQSVNNGRVTGKPACACNGCVYPISRWLDPMYYYTASTASPGLASGRAR